MPSHCRLQVPEREIASPTASRLFAASRLKPRRSRAPRTCSRAACRQSCRRRAAGGRRTPAPPRSALRRARTLRCARATSARAARAARAGCVCRRRQPDRGRCAPARAARARAPAVLARALAQQHHAQPEQRRDLIVAAARCAGVARDRRSAAWLRLDRRDARLRRRASWRPSAGRLRARRTRRAAPQHPRRSARRTRRAPGCTRA